MTGFTGKTVLITGASEGIGRALALTLASERPRLALNARNAARLAEAASACAALGAQVLELPGDVSRQEECAALVARTLAHFGALDVLVNNAGITMWSRFDRTGDLGVFAQLLATNYLGPVYLTAAALPALKAARGLIVAVASMAGLTGVPERSGYAASKHALVGFFESLRIELAGSGVDVTIVAPDFVVSEIHRRAIGRRATARRHSDARVAPHERRAVCAADPQGHAPARSAADHLGTRPLRPLGASHRPGDGGPHRRTCDPRASLTVTRRRLPADPAR